MSAAESIFTSIISERGRERFDATQLAIARKLASLLAAYDDNISASTIATLMALLPPKPETPIDPPYDLTRLSDRELAMLDYLTSRAAGLAAEKPKRKRHSARAICAIDLAERIDRLAAPRREAKGESWKLDQDEALAIRAAFCELVEPVATVTQIFEKDIHEAVAARRYFQRQADEAAKDAVAKAAPRFPSYSVPMNDETDVERFQSSNHMGCLNGRIRGMESQIRPTE
jgi:hypothetical protein